MSLAPDTIAHQIDMFNASTTLGGTSTGTGVGLAFGFPPGKKAIQVSLVTSATLTVKVQNSLDKNNWFDVSSSTVAPGFLSEVDSVVPFWRVNVTGVTTLGTGSAPALVVVMAQQGC